MRRLLVPTVLCVTVALLSACRADARERTGEGPPSTRPPAVASAPPPTMAPTMVPPTAAPAPAAPTLAGQDTARFDAFWPGFRRAALAGDTAALAAMADIPFRARGPLDDDPVVEYDRAAFVALLPLLLAADPGLSSRPSTMRALIESASAVPPGAVDGDEARVGEFVFTRRGGRWRFSRAYLPDTPDHLPPPAGGRAARGRSDGPSPGR